MTYRNLDVIELEFRGYNCFFFLQKQGDISDALVILWGVRYNMIMTLWASVWACIE